MVARPGASAERELVLVRQRLCSRNDMNNVRRTPSADRLRRVAATPELSRVSLSVLHRLLWTNNTTIWPDLHHVLAYQSDILSGFTAPDAPSRLIERAPALDPRQHDRVLAALRDGREPG